ncbi:glycosyltransferase [Lactobacillus delbrueckii]|nr:glycosyltransferase [Lactobacillus delbrueckii]
MVTNIIFISNYAAAYGGNFLASFKYLAECTKYKGGYNPYFIFPKAAEKILWEVDLSDFNVSYVEFDSTEYNRLILSILTEKTIIHTNFLDPKALIHLQKLVKGKRNVRLICQEHMRLNGSADGTRETNVLRRIKHQAKKCLYGNLLHSWQFIGVSTAVYNDLCDWYGKKRSHLVVNAISFQRLDRGYTPKLPSLDKPVATIFGTHFIRKGVDLAIRAVNNSSISDQIYLLILSHRPEEAQKNVVNAIGYIPKFIKISRVVDDVQEVYQKSFVFLSPSRSEAFGYAVVEAAYSLTQVIATDIPGQNTMKDVPGIRWVHNENVEELCKMIEDCYENRVLREEGMKGAKEYIVKHYSLDAWAEKMIGIYQKCFI